MTFLPMYISKIRLLWGVTLTTKALITGCWNSDVYCGVDMQRLHLMDPAQQP